MARELSLEVEVLGTAEADAALARLFNGFVKAGDSAEEASAKVEKFEKSYADGQARKRAKTELDALSGAAAKTGDAVEKSAKQVGVKDKALSSLTATVLRFAAPAVIGVAIKNTLDWAGGLSDLSKSTGISTTALQKFEIIGKASGVTMDQVANASLQLSNRVAGGDKSTARAMERLGLSMAQMASSTPDEAMLRLAKSLMSVENPQERVALAMDAGGRSMAKMLPMLGDLAEKWDDTQKVLDEGAIQSLDDAGDAIDELTTAGKKLIANVLVQFAPLMKIVAESLTGFVSSTMPSLQNWFNGVIEGFMRVEVAFRQFDDNMRNAGLRELDASDPARAGMLRQRNGIAPGGFFNDAQLAKDRLDAFKFQDSVVSGSGMPNMPPPFMPDITGGGRAGRARVLPFRQSTFATGSAAATMFAMANTPGMFNAGSLPFMSSLPFLQSGASPISFANGSGLAGTVPMNAPGGGGGLGGFLSGHKTQLAGLGLGLMSRFIPQGGRVGGALSGAAQGASMGAMFGPWGMGIGAAAGGLMGLFTGGKAKKNARNAEISQVFEQFSSKEFIAMQKEADRLGISLEKALKAKTMKDFGAAVDEVAGKIKAMTDLEDEIASLTKAVTVDFDKMNAVVQEFGLDVSKLGPTFQQLKIDKEAQRIIDAMAIMEKGGADMSGVLEGMADEISKVVQDSIKFGTTIPENMKPWIEELIKSGKLVDENGKAITDMSKIKFGAAMESDMSKLTKKLDELIAQLAKLAEGFATAAGAAADLGNVEYPNPGGGNPDGGQSQNGSGSPGFATGGVAGRDFRRPGHGDIFPALLKRGETVLPAGVGRGGVSLSIGNLSVGSGYGSRTEAVEEIGDAVVRYLERRGTRLVA